MLPLWLMVSLGLGMMALRRDGWIVLLQTIAQILHPFNPLVWLTDLRLSRYREQICDDFALQHVPIPARQYGEMLLRFLEAAATSKLEVRAGTCFFETANGFKQCDYAENSFALKFLHSSDAKQKAR